jgi:hypothetical protein
MKNKTVWTYKGNINTYNQSTNKISKEYVKGIVVIKRLSYNFYIVKVESKDLTYSNIFMGNNDQIIGSFSPNDYTIFYTTSKGKLMAKFYTLESNNKTKFGDFVLEQKSNIRG